ncbi:MAG: hypothetical protein KDB03_25990 [Planctomycetales bacterium]|nr:hypothetical protein [Planctomycetales bacterium]
MPKRFSLATVLAGISLIAVSLGVAVWYFDIPHKPVEKLPRLHGQTERSVLNRLGKPDQKYEFTMDDAVGEFRIELYNTYPPNSPNNSTVEIRELTWEYPRYKLTVWLHRPNGTWTVLDTCRYRNGIMF